MKKVLTTFILGMVYSFSQAQNPGPPPMPGPEQQLKHLETILKPKLKISPDQWQNLEKSFKEFFAKADKLRKDNPPPPPKPEMEKSIKKFESDRDLAIQKILTPNQFSEYKKLENQLRPPRPGGPGGEEKPNPHEPLGSGDPNPR